MVGTPCGGCQFHTFPYKIAPPILIDGKRTIKTFKNIDDVWDIVDLLIEEIKELNMTRGNEFDIVESINAQLPFFTCINYFIDKDIQKDIKRYVYCKDLGVSPYKGSFNEHPAIWVDKYFLIKRAFAKLEKKQIDASKNERSK